MCQIYGHIAFFASFVLLLPRRKFYPRQSLILRLANWARSAPLSHLALSKIGIFFAGKLQCESTGISAFRHRGRPFVACILFADMA
jgi:hypothetical protein